MIEAVLVVPALMIVLLVVIQFALWAHAAQVAQLAASEGDRAARALGGGPDAGAAVARSILRGPGSDLAASTVTADVMAGDIARVQVSGNAVAVLPGLSFLSLSVSATEIGPVQEFRSSE